MKVQMILSILPSELGTLEAPSIEPLPTDRIPEEVLQYGICRRDKIQEKPVYQDSEMKEILQSSQKTQETEDLSPATMTRTQTVTRSKL